MPARRIAQGDRAVQRDEPKAVGVQTVRAPREGQVGKPAAGEEQQDTILGNTWAGQS
jgi:hypothetical protein